MTAVFEYLVSETVQLWFDFYKFWIDLQDTVPVHMLRYEDLMTDPEPALRGAVEFVLGVEDIAGTRAEKYLRAAVAQDRPVVYKPRKAAMNTNLHLYSSELLEAVKRGCSYMLRDLQPELFSPDGVWPEEPGYTPTVSLAAFNARGKDPARVSTELEIFQQEKTDAHRKILDKFESALRLWNFNKVLTWFIENDIADKDFKVKLIS